MSIIEVAKRFADRPRPLLMMASYRVAHFASVHKSGFGGLNLIWAAPILIAYRLVTECLLGYEIPPATNIGPGFFIHHGFGVVINKHTVIGARVSIRHGVTIGCKTLPDGSQGPSPTIEDDVEIGAGAMIIGGVRIGKGAKIGAGSVVVHDVPDHAVVMGNPAVRVK